jgi:hypothetical protein
MPTLMRGVAAAIIVAALCLTTALPAGAQTEDTRAALQTFAERVTAYTDLHRRLEAPLPPLTASTSERSTILNKKYVAAAMKAARPQARQGDIFTPAVEREIRTRIATALEGDGAQALRRDRPLSRPFHPRVFDTYPDWGTDETPPALLAVLPPLPEGLEYRLLDHDLVLTDVHADLIVDVIADAVPRGTS